MLTPDATESIKLLKSLAATLGLLLLVSNVMWYIAFTTATGPLDKPTPSPSITVTPTPESPTFSPTVTTSSIPTASPVAPATP